MLNLIRFLMSFVAVQHERKPIIDKKENNGGMPNNSTGPSKYARRKDVSSMNNQTSNSPYMGLFAGFNFAELQNSIEAQQRASKFLFNITIISILCSFPPFQSLRQATATTTILPLSK